MRIDSHQHFWHYNPDDYAWMGDLNILKQDYLPAYLQPALIDNGLEATVAVQARQSLTENDYLLELAEKNDFIKGVVGWVDLCAADAGEKLSRYAGKLTGIRHLDTLDGSYAVAVRNAPGDSRNIQLHTLPMPFFFDRADHVVEMNWANGPDPFGYKSAPALEYN